MNSPHRHSPAWLETAVFYEIYPQSFADSNGDGIGDLRGIIGRLPYLRDLGITGIWLNPCFESPFGDAGYDVADFYQVAPRYGTNEDLRELFAVARGLGLRVLLDLVAGHTSNRHPWFQASQRAARNEYTDWYIWNNSIWDWAAPNQQLVVGAAERAANYVTNFFHFQPALNYGYARPDPKHPWQQPTDAPGPQAVRAELRKIMAFWLDLGASGFRVDMAGSLVKNDPDGQATGALWRGIRTWLDKAHPECALVAEWSQPQISLPHGFHMDFLLAFAKPGYRALFRAEPGRPAIFDRSGATSFRVFLDEYEPLLRATADLGFIAIPSGNHDTTPRLGNGRDSRDLAVAHAFLLTMPGVPFIYYGDEIGLVSPPLLPTKEGGFERTAARTPMQWDDTDNAGFSRAPADRLYLPVDPSPARPTVAAQAGDAGSPLGTVKLLAALRRSCPALAASGGFSILASGDGQPCVYERAKDGERIVVALNPAGAARAVRLPADFHAGRLHLLAGATGAFRREPAGWTAALPPASYAIARIEK